MKEIIFQNCLRRAFDNGAVAFLLIFSPFSCGAIPSTSESTQPPESSGRASSEHRETSSANENGLANEDSRFPHINIDGTSSKTKKITYRFPFEGKTVMLSLPVNKALIKGAQNASKYAVAVEGKTDFDWKTHYNLAFINDPAQTRFLDDLHDELLKIARKLTLDSDRTVELMTSFVQNIRYDTQENGPPRFPVETFAEQQGDCDDKSRLLVSLLIRSNYRVATLHFDEEKHMAVGIKSNAMAYKNTGYTYIETTTPSFIGFPFAENANVKLHTTPAVHPVGSGQKKYTGARDVQFIADAMASMDRDIKKTQTSLEDINSACKEAEQTVAQRQRQLADATSEADTKYNRYVSRYNQAVDDYNTLIKKQQRLANAINRKIDLRNYIARHSVDRYPTVREVKKRLKEIDKER